MTSCCGFSMRPCNHTRKAGVPATATLLDDCKRTTASLVGPTLGGTRHDKNEFADRVGRCAAAGWLLRRQARSDRTVGGARPRRSARTRRCAGTGRAARTSRGGRSRGADRRRGRPGSNRSTRPEGRPWRARTGRGRGTSWARRTCWDCGTGRTGRDGERAHGSGRRRRDYVQRNRGAGLGRLQRQ
jgi:hypothetical protein